ncbi:GNAT family N-acetyltransferase [Salmonella enterica]|nr:GNAT family N-acetyltransferase [Salmonella enterica]EJH7440002.1 GNAT family N-acetyltransferase [Salmonella enterica]EJH7879077.1 GNAT family N-acetyltransferase [Salmonella enterica]EJI6712086.1 GNAT family N-acetyltransferase [Salmonella enterica]
MAAEQQPEVITNEMSAYAERPRLEILHVYERESSNQYWGTGIVETVYNDPDTDPLQDFHEEDRITIYFERITGNENSRFYLTASHTYRECFSSNTLQEIISLTGGSVFITNELYRGQRIGTWMMNEIVKWAKQWPNSEIVPITIGYGDAYKENKERRNWFYEQFGIKFKYHNDRHEAGKSRPMKAAALNTVDSWDKSKGGNIIIQSCYDFMISLVDENNKLIKDKNILIRENERLNKKLCFFESKPIKTGIKQFLGRNFYR